MARCAPAGVAGSLIAAGVILDAAPASAHGIGGRTDLPLPLWLFTYGAAAALVLSFVALRALWPRPRLAAAAQGTPMPAPAQRLTPLLEVAGRTLGLASLVLVLTAATWGDPSAADNLAPVAVYVMFWVGMQVVSAVTGDVWRLLNPFDTIAAGIRRGVGRAPARPEAGPEWTAAVMLFSFLWLELAYFESAEPRAIAIWLTAYTTLAVAGGVAWGRDWLRRSEGFGVLFGLLAHLAPIGRDEEGRLRLRAPLSGLSQVHATPGIVGVIIVTLGSTTFDGLSRTTFWVDVLGSRTGWGRTGLNTIGLVWVIAIVWVAYQLAVRAAARTGKKPNEETALSFAASLIPIVFAYTLAHYFSLLVFESQGAIALLSDPYGWGWDLLGTADNRIDYTVLSTATIAYVQAGAIVVGHVAGVVAAHDRSVELWPRRVAERTQYPMLAVMIAYTVGGLAILLGG